MRIAQPGHKGTVTAVAAVLLVASLSACSSSSSKGSGASSTGAPTSSASSSTASSSSATSGAGSTSPGSSGSGTTVDAKSAQSVAAFGGMAGLIAAAKKEGKLNLIAIPPTWAGYGPMVTAFSKKYGIKINSENPNGASADELAAIKATKGQPSAPDAVDVGNSFALSGAQDGL